MSAARSSATYSKEGPGPRSGDFEDRSMSRIGKKPVTVPSNVTATVSGQTVTVKGAKGELSFTMPEEIKVEKTAEGIEVSPREETNRSRAMWGMARTQVVNLIDG